MPVYNKEKYVRASIESILRQTYPYFELLVIDDGSTDSCGSIIQSLKDSRLCYIRQENGGESSARNHGIRLAKNEFVTFLDSDDLWLPDYLETMNDLINRYPDKRVFGSAYCNEPVKEETLEKIISLPKSNTVHYSDNYFQFTLTHPQSLTSSTTVLHKRVFEKSGMFPLGLKNWVDLDLWARIGMDYSIVFTERICAIYNDLPDSASKAKTRPHAPFVDHYKDFLKRSDLSADKKKFFREYVINLKMQSAYKQFVWDGKGWDKFLELLPFWNTRMHRKKYISIMIQFLIGTERFYKILAFLKGGKYDETAKN